MSRFDVRCDELKTLRNVGLVNVMFRIFSLISMLTHC